ncbi:hypothetical protein BDW22DRAFT_1242597 [Trametopsis cervina]|nr:hypothetical protein BDW22DRAFT_1242597 [Trametopsis cervina]
MAGGTRCRMRWASCEPRRTLTRTEHIHRTAQPQTHMATKIEYSPMNANLSLTPHSSSATNERNIGAQARSRSSSLTRTHARQRWPLNTVTVQDVSTENGARGVTAETRKRGACASLTGVATLRSDVASRSSHLRLPSPSGHVHEDEEEDAVAGRGSHGHIPARNRRLRRARRRRFVSSIQRRTTRLERNREVEGLINTGCVHGSPELELHARTPYALIPCVFAATLFD